MKGLTWVMWRRHRAVAWTALALTAVASCCIGYWFYRQTAFQQDHGIAGCDILLPVCHGKAMPDWDSRAYGDLTGELRLTHREALLNAGSALLYVPLLVAVFIGAPLFARDLENGTYRLAITQSVSPRRWLAAKLAFAVALTAGATLVVTALYGWWWHSTWRDFGDLIWDSPTPFFNAGPAAVAIALLALVLGATIGLVVRRTLPAMAISLAVCGGMLGLLRKGRLPEHLWPVSTARAAPGSYADIPRYARYRFEGYETASGEKLSNLVCVGSDPERARCRDRHDVVSSIAEYHAAGDYWPMQGVLAGGCLAVAAVLVAGCLWWGGRRPA